jgi:hypothetical protein
LFIDEPHQLKILSRNRLCFVVKTGSADIQQLALAHDAQLWLGSINHLRSLFTA